MEIEISAVNDLEAMVLKDPAPTRVPRKYIGKLKCFLHDANGVPRVFIGPDYPLFLVIAILASAFVGINVGLLFEISKLKTYPIFPFFITTGLVLLGIYSVLKTFIGDPGLPKALLLGISEPKSLKAADSKLQYC